MAISQEVAAQLGHNLIRVVKLFGSMRQHAPRLHPGVDVAAYPIMFNLSHGPRRVSALADCVHSDVSTVSRQVSALVGHGLVEKLPDPQDGRVAMLSLTDEGAALIERLMEQRSAWFQDLLKDWEPAEATAFSASLDRFAGSVEASRDRRAGTRPDTPDIPAVTPAPTMPSELDDHATTSEESHATTSKEQ